MTTITDLFIGNPKWNRPTPGANRCVIEAGCHGCICVPSNATRVVVEMWGQGGGGPSAFCCTWGRTGGQGGSYGAKVWKGNEAPAATGCCISFCGCVCACDCRAPCNQTCGHPGQFSRLTNCATGNPTVCSWIGCVNGGAGGCSLCSAASWVCCGETYDCNRKYDTCCIKTTSTSLPEYYSICCMSTAQSGSCTGGSRECCDGASCYCAANYCSATCAGDPHCYSNEAVICSSSSAGACGFDGVFEPVDCSCFDVYRLGACGFTVNSNLGYNGSWNYCHIGNGGAAYGGGAQQLRNFSNGNFAYCGYAGNFPGGGGKSSGACGGGVCCGSIGGGGVILVSWDT